MSHRTLRAPLRVAGAIALCVLGAGAAATPATALGRSTPQAHAAPAHPAAGQSPRPAVLPAIRGNPTGIDAVPDPATPQPSRWPGGGGGGAAANGSDETFIRVLPDMPWPSSTPSPSRSPAGATPGTDGPF